MANSWLRLYAEFATDPKVQMLSEADQRRFVMLLCLRCCNGDETLRDEEVAFQLRISTDEWAQTKQRLLERRLIGEDSKPRAWNKRQFVSDSSTARVAKHRAKAATAAKRECNVSVTPPDTDTDTDTERNTPPISPPPPKPRAKTQAAEKPDGVTDGVWTDFTALRKAKHAPLTATALDVIEREAVKAKVSLQTALETCCARGWQGFRADWYAQNATERNRTQSFAQQDREAGMLRWEQMTGRQHPDRVRPTGTVIEIQAAEVRHAIV